MKSTNRHSKLKHFFHEIAEETVLHGVKYVANSNRGRIERIFWGIIFLGSVALAVYSVQEFVSRFLGNPVMTTFQSEETTISRIPFPAITICNANIMKRKVLGHAFDKFLAELDKQTNRTESNRNLDQLTEDILSLEFLTQYCLASPSFLRLINQTLYDIKGHVDIAGRLLRLLEDLEREDIGNRTTFDPEKAKKYHHRWMHFINKASHSCDDMHLKCMWDGKLFPCGDYFHHVKTAHGICCTFNNMPRFVMTKMERNSSYARWEQSHRRLSDKEVREWEDFGNGDIIKRVDEEGGDDRTYPFYQTSGGVNFGLSIMLNPELESYSTCNSNDGIGLKLLAHSHFSFPNVVDYGVVVPTSSEVFVNVEPDVTLANEEDLKDADVETRGCYFPSDEDAKLRTFRYYSSANCRLDCVTEQVYANCSCQNFYRATNPTEMCTAQGHTCTERVQEELATSYSSNCKQCRPACSEIKYRVHSSHFPLPREVLPKFIFNTPHHFNKTATNYSIVHVYIGMGAVYAKERMKMFSAQDLLANVGGTLGLAVGFSIVSVVQLVYFFTLRAFTVFRVKEGKIRNSESVIHHLPSTSRARGTVKPNEAGGSSTSHYERHFTITGGKGMKRVNIRSVSSRLTDYP